MHEALEMLFGEGLANVFKRHDRFAEATRRAVRAWGLEILCVNPAEYSSALTAVLMPEGHNADAFRKIVLPLMTATAVVLGLIAGGFIASLEPDVHLDYFLSAALRATTGA